MASFISTGNRKALLTKPRAEAAVILLQGEDRLLRINTTLFAQLKARLDEGKHSWVLGGDPTENYATRPALPTEAEMILHCFRLQGKLTRHVLFNILLKTISGHRRCAA